jgi:hypothetical protein
MFSDHGLSDMPATGAYVIAPHNTNKLTRPVRGIYVGTGGNLRVLTRDGDDVTFTGVPGGVILPVVAMQVFVTGTTATGLVGMV